ncbi:hypothetical protein [Evansella halocellulosilytica]|nr:hypothetical protein [Evansella halocellulosilytica]
MEMFIMFSIAAAVICYILSVEMKVTKLEKRVKELEGKSSD